MVRIAILLISPPPVDATQIRRIKMPAESNYVPLYSDTWNLYHLLKCCEWTKNELEVSCRILQFSSVRYLLPSLHAYQALKVPALLGTTVVSVHYLEV